MNKLKYLFLIILCAGLISGATNVLAQSVGDKVLVVGKKPLKQSEVDSLIEFYEWAFETKFTSAERGKFQAFTENDFRRDAAESRKTIDDFIGTFAKIRVADKDVQQKTRETFVSVFVEELRKHAGDGNAEFMLNIYETARGNSLSDSNVAAVSADYTKDPIDKTGNISNLTGKWVWGRSGSSSYTTFGSLLGSNGSRHTYQFSPNGTVEYVGIMNVMTGGCNMQVFSTKKGKASISGDTLTIDFAPASFSRDDSCSPSKNYKKTLPAATETYKIKLKNDYGQTQLCMMDKEETCYSKTSN